MSRMNYSECKFDWQDAANKIKEIVKGIESLHYSAILACSEEIISQEEKGLTRLIARLSDAEAAISGLSYLCTPQSEWTGGESFKLRAPHIVTDRH